MKSISSDQLGSWDCAVTTCGGCWKIRGHYGSSLFYGHLSMRGADRICNADLWQGTAKAAEGHLAQLLWARAKEEGMLIHLQPRDLDTRMTMNRNPKSCCVEGM